MRRKTWLGIFISVLSALCPNQLGRHISVIATPLPVTCPGGGGSESSLQNFSPKQTPCVEVARHPEAALWSFCVPGLPYVCNVILFLSCPLALGGEFRGPLGKFPKQPGSYVLGVRLFTHGHNVHCWLWGCLRKNHAWAPLHGLLHPRGTGKNSLL